MEFAAEVFNMLLLYTGKWSGVENRQEIAQNQWKRHVMELYLPPSFFLWITIIAIVHSSHVLTCAFLLHFVICIEDLFQKEARGKQRSIKTSDPIYVRFNIPCVFCEASSAEKGKGNNDRCYNDYNMCLERFIGLSLSEFAVLAREHLWLHATETNRDAKKHLQILCSFDHESDSIRFH